MQVTIPDDVLEQLDERARRSGDNRAHVAAKLIEKGLREETIDEILKPFRTGFQASGMSEDELTHLMDSELQALRAEERAPSATRM